MDYGLVPDSFSQLLYQLALSVLCKAVMKHCTLSTRALPGRLSALRQGWRSYDYPGQHQQRTMLLPLQVKQCLDAKQSFVKHLMLLWQFRHSGGVTVLSKALCIQQRSVQLLPPTARERRLRLCFLRGALVGAARYLEGQSDSPLSPPTSSLSQLPHASVLSYWNIITMWPTNGGLRDEGN